MPVYATIDDLKLYGLPAARVDALIVSLGSPALDGALAAVSSEADSHLRKVAKLPLSAWGVVLRQKVCHIVVVDLLTQDGWNPDAPGDISIVSRAKDARRWLERLSAGEVDLDFTDSQDPPQQTLGAVVVITDSPRNFGAGL